MVANVTDVITQASQGLAGVPNAALDGGAVAPVLRSRADPASEAFRANAAAHGGLAHELRERLAAARLGGPERARQRHVERGKLLPRDRVDTLLDPGSPFLELSPLAADGMYDGDAPAAGIITGV